MNQPNRKEIKQKAKEIIKGKMWDIWKPLLIFLLILFVFVFIFVSFKIVEQSNLLGVILIFILCIVVFIFTLGYFSYIMKLIRGQEYSISDLFSFYKQKLGLSVLTQIVVSVIIYICSLIGTIAFSVIFLPALVDVITFMTDISTISYNTLIITLVGKFLFSLLFFIPAVVVSLGYSMIHFLLIESNGNEKVINIVKNSWNLMKGHKWNYFVFILSFILWNLLGIITFGVAFIYVLPYLSVSHVLYYEELRKNNMYNIK